MLCSARASLYGRVNFFEKKTQFVVALLMNNSHLFFPSIAPNAAGF